MNGTLHAHDSVTVQYHRAALNSSSTIHVGLELDGITIGNGTISFAVGEDTAVATIHTVAPANMSSRERTLRAEFHAGPLPSGASVRVRYEGSAPQPPALDGVRAEYVIGMGFRVSGRLSDDDAVTLTVETPYGARSALRTEGEWSIDVPVLPTRLGAHNLTVFARDVDDNATIALPLLVDVVGRPTLVANLTHGFPLGIHAVPEQVLLPPRLLEGEALATCGGNGTCDPTTLAAIHVSLTARTGPDHCLWAWGVVRASTPCEFTTGVGPGSASILWAQARGTVSLVIRGVVV